MWHTHKDPVPCWGHTGHGDQLVGYWEEESEFVGWSHKLRQPQQGHSRDQVQSLDLVEVLRCSPLADHQGPSVTNDDDVDDVPWRFR